MISFVQTNYIQIVNIHTCELKLIHKFDDNLIKYLSCNTTPPQSDHLTNYVVDTRKFTNLNNPRILAAMVLESMEFLLYECENDTNLRELLRIPPPGHEITSLRFIGNESEFLNDYILMCFSDSSLGILDLNDLCTFNVAKSRIKNATSYKVIDDSKNVCLLIGTNNQCLYVVNANESFSHYLSILIEINGKFSSGKIMKTSYEIETNFWSCRICAMSAKGNIFIYDVSADLVNQNQYNILKIAEFTAHSDAITFAYVKGTKLLFNKFLSPDLIKPFPYQKFFFPFAEN